MTWKKLNEKINEDFLKNNDVKVTVQFEKTPFNKSMPNLTYQWHYNHETGKLEDLIWDDCIMKKAVEEINGVTTYYPNAIVKKLYRENPNTLNGYAIRVPKLNVRKMF